MGIALRETGEVEAAIEHFRRAVELDPGFAAAQTNLGQIHLDRGEAEAALPHCQEAVRLQPNIAAMHHNLGNALRALERYLDARAAYLEALRIDPNLAMAHAHLGLTLGKENATGEALQWLKRATELEPRNAMFWEYLAEAHDELEEPAQANPCWRRMLELGEERAGPHLSLGWALQEEGHIDEAMEHYRAAARLNPEGGMPPMSLAGVYEEQGKLEEAEGALREAIRLQPKFALPHARLATLLRGKFSDEDLAALEERIANEDIGKGPRARMLFGLAHVLDARRDYERAAECLRKANALTLEVNHKRRDYAPDEHREFVDMLLNQFHPDFFRRLRRRIGFPSARLRIRLAALGHDPDRAGAGEPSRDLRRRRTTPGATHLRRFAGCRGARRTSAQRAGPADAAGDRLPGRRPSRSSGRIGRRSRAADRRQNARQLYVPGAARGPLSAGHVYPLPARPARHRGLLLDDRFPQYPLGEFARAHHDALRAVLALMDHWRRVLPVPIHDVDYEEMVEDQEAVSRRLIERCGLEWDPACLEFYRHERPVRTASVTQVREPVYKRSVARWKNYEADLAEVFAALCNSRS